MRSWIVCRNTLCSSHTPSNRVRPRPPVKRTGKDVIRGTVLHDLWDGSQGNHSGHCDEDVDQS